MSTDGYDPLRHEYSACAIRYDGRWSKYVERSIGATLQRCSLSAGERVLDVGCGTGVLLAELARSEPQVELAGVDLSAAMLDQARRKLGSAADLCLAGAESMPFGDAGFDVVVSTSVFHFIRHPHDALAEMQRVLKPGGRIVITDWCRDFLTCRVLDAWLRAFNSAHYRTFTGAELGRMLADAGFGHVNVERYKITRLWGLMTATGQSMNC